MLKKEDWISYFEALNEREPSAEELAEALAKGEFTEDVVPTLAQEPVEALQPEQVASPGQTAPQTPQAPAAPLIKPEQVAALKGQASVLTAKAKKHQKPLLAALLAVAVLFFGFRFMASQPKSLASLVEVEFTGYDGSGSLTYNSEDLEKAIAEYAYKKAGLSSSEAKGLASADPIVQSRIYTDVNKSAKYRQGLAMIETVSYSFEKSNGLSNDEEVAFVVTTTSKESPVKAESKSFKVKGLKAYDTVKVADVLKDEGVSVSGFNGYGSLVLSKDSSYSDVFESDDSLKGLKNGDKVTLTVSDNYLFSLKNDGKTVDETSIEYEVKGLPELTSLTNLADLLAKNDTYAKSRHENTSYRTYTLERQKDYLAYSPASDATSSGQVFLVTVYKITEQGSSSTSVEYNYFGYRAYVRKDNTLDIETASQVSGSSTKDYENMVASLESEGFKVYEAQ